MSSVFPIAEAVYFRKLFELMTNVISRIFKMKSRNLSKRMSIIRAYSIERA